jgi:hypothetical protein
MEAPAHQFRSPIRQDPLIRTLSVEEVTGWIPASLKATADADVEHPPASNRRAGQAASKIQSYP